MARKLNEDGNVLEERHLIDLILDTGENGDQIDEPLIVEASRDEFKALCGVLQRIGDGAAWLKLCLRVQVEYLSEKEKTWKQMNLFSIAYNDDLFDEWVSVRLLRSDLFYPLCFWTLHQLSQGRLTPEMSNECIDMFQEAGWPETIRYLERKLDLHSSDIFDRLSGIDRQKPSSGHVCPQCQGKGFLTYSEVFCSLDD
jgi:hypothetical protein